MKKRKYAVITGDIVDSTIIAANYQDVLHAIAGDIDRYVAQESIFEIFRGDSFQMLIRAPKKALLVGLLFRVGMRRYSNGSVLEDAWDARVSVGVGSINEAKLAKNAPLGTLDGEAFLRSGRTLDQMKPEGAFLKITTGVDSVDQALNVCTSLADALIARWSTTQAEALYLYLLRDLTQKEIGSLLKVSQRAIGLRLESAQFHNLQPFLRYFEKII